jgi:hypothetical protein
MNPFTFVSNVSRNSQSNVEKLKDNQPFYKSPEIVAIIVFGCIYVFIRLIETYITPRIPEILTREVSALFRWGPILVPIIFGITYFSKKKTVKKTLVNSSINSSDEVLKKRMMSWTKK